MAVDPSKTRMVLVVHGVQTGTDDQLDQDRLVAALMKSRLGSQTLAFDTDLYRYEGINDAAQAEFKRKYLKLHGLLEAIPVAGTLAADSFSLVADVVTARDDTSTAAKIREGLKSKILEIYGGQQPCYVVAHSLGSIYAFDVINELMQSPDFFNRNNRAVWPVQGLLTIGSPIGLAMFRNERRWVTPLGSGQAFFRWMNYWDRNDPVVSGAIFGQSLPDFHIAEDYLTNPALQGWDIQDKAVDTGNVWLMAHVAYWENPVVGDGLLDLVMH